MHQLFLERSFGSPLSRDNVIAIARDSAWCMEMYRVAWHGSLLSADGRKLFCRFSAADAESVRNALRKAQADMAVFWSGTVHDAAGAAEPNVLVERSFAEPASLDALQAREEEHVWCLETRNVQFARTYFSTDRRRMCCLYAAPDAEAVREAQREAGIPFERVWAFERISPEHVAA